MYKEIINIYLNYLIKDIELFNFDELLLIFNSKLLKNYKNIQFGSNFKYEFLKLIENQNFELSKSEFENLFQKFLLNKEVNKKIFFLKKNEIIDNNLEKFIKNQNYSYFFKIIFHYKYIPNNIIKKILNNLEKNEIFEFNNETNIFNKNFLIFFMLIQKNLEEDDIEKILRILEKFFEKSIEYHKNKKFKFFLYFEIFKILEYIDNEILINKIKYIKIKCKKIYELFFSYLFRNKKFFENELNNIEEWYQDFNFIENLKTKIDIEILYDYLLELTFLIDNENKKKVLNYINNIFIYISYFKLLDNLEDENQKLWDNFINDILLSYDLQIDNKYFNEINEGMIKLMNRYFFLYPLDEEELLENLFIKFLDKKIKNLHPNYLLYYIYFQIKNNKIKLNNKNEIIEEIKNLINNKNYKTKIKLKKNEKDELANFIIKEELFNYFGSFLINIFNIKNKILQKIKNKYNLFNTRNIIVHYYTINKSIDPYTKIELYNLIIKNINNNKIKSVLISNLINNINYKKDYVFFVNIYKKATKKIKKILLLNLFFN